MVESLAVSVAASLAVSAAASLAVFVVESLAVSAAGLVKAYYGFHPPVEYRLPDQ
ncbi:MAG: hypothetical protein LBN31_06845 [Hungatella sp.]|nr:hypothetical protein [Hungatella sp.]